MDKANSLTCDKSQISQYHSHSLILSDQGYPVTPLNQNGRKVKPRPSLPPPSIHPSVLITVIVIYIVDIPVCACIRTMLRIRVSKAKGI